MNHSITQVSDRFIVRATVGYDFGAGTRDLGVIGKYATLLEARAARDAYGAVQTDNSGAQYRYAVIVDQEDEHAVVGFGYFGDGSRITSVRPLEAVLQDDDVLFRGSRRECEGFKVDQLLALSPA